MKKLTTKDYKRIAKESALLTSTTKAYIKFMKLRLPNEAHEDYAAEWAERFAHQTDWLRSDSKSRKILIKIGYRNKKGELKK